MSPPPTDPKIYHITHVDNLPGIVAEGGLVCDAEMFRRGGPNTSVGMTDVKQRRFGLSVKCHAGDVVADYVPFYFCPRSVMLYIIHMGNHPALAYKGGQGPIVHLESDLHEVLRWAESDGRRWAFTKRNAAIAYAEFYSDRASLDQIDWRAVQATDFSSRDIQELKWAEFLVRESFPWRLVSRIGVISETMRRRVEAVLPPGDGPAVEVRREWYY